MICRPVGQTAKTLFEVQTAGSEYQFHQSLLLKEDAITVVASTAIATEGATGLPKFTAFKWYNLAIDLDTDTDTADIYIDGQLATKVKFRTCPIT